MNSAAPAAPPDPAGDTDRTERFRLDPDALDILFAELSEAGGIVAGISGGPDSTALMHALARWTALAPRPPVILATIDHGLRPGSALEAERVAAIAARLGLTHRTLAWAGPKPANGVQEAARAARYALLNALAAEQGATHVVTAHTLDDQAETVLMRLSRGSGVAGLAGMRRRSETGGLVHLRPFLHVRKAALLAACRDHAWAFHDDPANRDPRFARSRWRAILPLLAAEGLDPACLGRLAARAAEADAALAVKAREALDRITLGSAGGGIRLDGQAFAGEPFAIAVRILGQVLQRSRPEAGHLRLERVESCAREIGRAVRAREQMRRTLGGRVIALDRSGALTIRPEPARRRGRTGLVNHAAAAAPHSLGKGGGRT